MQNNWYAVYTKAHCERKVSLSLKKRNIEYFCPLNNKKSRQLFLSVTVEQAVFSSYVFVKCSESEIVKLTKEIPAIRSLLYWKNKPATIKEEEIVAIKDFISNHQEITIEKLETNFEKDNSSVSYLMDGQILMIKNRIMKLRLPSLHLQMIAKLKEGEGVIGREISFGNKEMLVTS